MTCADCASERESRLRAEAEVARREGIAEGQDRLRQNAEEARVRAERERDEARADLSAAEGQERALDAAQKRIEGLEAENASLRLWRDTLEPLVKAAFDWVQADDARVLVVAPALMAKMHDEARKAWRTITRALAALSSPAVTAEGKKLGEEKVE